jgi:hypothetical protein
MDDAGNFYANLRHDPEFFFQFPAHSIARLFAVFDLASRKFPFERHGLVPRPLAGEDQAIFHNQRGYNSFHVIQVMFKIAGLPGDRLLVLQSLAHQLSAIFHQFAVFASERRGKMTVNIEFAHHVAVHKDWNNDLRLGFERAGKIA